MLGLPRLVVLFMSAPAAAAVAPAVVPRPNLYVTRTHGASEVTWHCCMHWAQLAAVMSCCCTQHRALGISLACDTVWCGLGRQSLWTTHPGPPGWSAWRCWAAAEGLLLLNMVRSCCRKFSSVLVASAAGVLRWLNIPIGPKREPAAAGACPDPSLGADGPAAHSLVCWTAVATMHACTLLAAQPPRKLVMHSFHVTGQCLLVSVAYLGRGQPECPRPCSLNTGAPQSCCAHA